MGVTMRAAALVTAMAAVGCAGHGLSAQVPVGGSAGSWRYDVAVEPGGKALRVDAWLPPGSLADLVVRAGSDRFVKDVEVEDSGGWDDVRRRGSAFHAPECARGCHLRYRFELRKAAEALHDVDAAMAWGDVVEAAPSTWLLHPTLAPYGTRYRFHVQTPAGVSFATGVFTAAEGPPNTYEAEATNIAVAPYAVFGPVRARSVEAVPGATLDVAIAPGPYSVTDDALVDWVARSARTMARFLGCFPVERTMIVVVPVAGASVRHGETMGDGGASMVVEVGEEADERALSDDWVLPHEMAHLAVPSVSRRHHWIEEGLAVYMQPIARARAGELEPEDVWREFALGMPKGAPTRVGHGLDDAQDWARTYWGGATFCLLADIEMRRRTGGRVGLEDAMRGVLASGGSVARIWDFGRLLEAVDGAAGVPVTSSMHGAMERGAWTVDLAGVFRDLGVVLEGTRVHFVEDAPLAAIRRAITSPIPVSAREPTACRAASPGSIAQR
jgi:hypothetical protein